MIDYKEKSYTTPFAYKNKSNIPIKSLKTIIVKILHTHYGVPLLGIKGSLIRAGM